MQSDRRDDDAGAGAKLGAAGLVLVVDVADDDLTLTSSVTDDLCADRMQRGAAQHDDVGLDQRYRRVGAVGDGRVRHGDRSGRRLLRGDGYERLMTQDAARRGVLIGPVAGGLRDDEPDAVYHARDHTTASLWGHTMATEPDDDGLDPKMMEHFASFLDARDAQQEREAARKRPPKDVPELIDRIADAVLDRAEERAQKRRDAEAELDDDDAPSRSGGGKSGGGLTLRGILGGSATG